MTPFINYGQEHYGNYHEEYYYDKDAAKNRFNSLRRVKAKNVKLNRKTKGFMTLYVVSYEGRAHRAVMGSSPSHSENIKIGSAFRELFR